MWPHRSKYLKTDLSIIGIRNIESEFFAKSSYSPEFSEKLGVQKLTETLNELQKAEVAKNILDIEKTLSIAERHWKTKVNSMESAAH